MKICRYDVSTYEKYIPVKGIEYTQCLYDSAYSRASEKKYDKSRGEYSAPMLCRLRARVKRKAEYSVAYAYRRERYQEICRL